MSDKMELSDRIKSMKFMQRAANDQLRKTVEVQQVHTQLLAAEKDMWIVEGYESIATEVPKVVVDEDCEEAPALFDFLPGRRSFQKKNPAVERHVQVLLGEARETVPVSKPVLTEDIELRPAKKLRR